MTKTPLRKSPLQSPINTAEFLRTFVYNRAPTSADYKNFKISDLWIHRDPSGTPPYGYYVLVDKPNNTGVWLDIGGQETGDVQTLSDTAGTTVPPTTTGNIQLVGGTGMTITSTPGSNLLTFDSSSPSLTWSVDTSSPISVGTSEGHIANAGGAITYNIPSTFSVGVGFAFLDLGGNGFVLQAQAGQTIRLGNQVTSSGGTVTSTAIGDAIWLVGAVANTTLLGYGAQGNLTFA
jgi:hypothetical protein